MSVIGRQYRHFRFCREQVCVFATAKTPTAHRRVGKLAFCSRWSQKGKEGIYQGYIDSVIQ